jgi:hypothetical protein
VKYHVFARILAVCRARAITNPTIHSASFECNEAEWMVGIVLAGARHTAKIRAKSLIGQKKTIVIIAHLCSEMAVLGRKSYLPASLIDPILNNQSMLFLPT